MLILFPFIYLLSLLFATKEIAGGEKQGILLFFIFGLSIYSTTLSTLYELGLADSIILFQPVKELIVLAVLALCMWYYRGKIHLHPVDYVVGAFFSLSLIYLFLPIGEYGFFERLSAFKSSSFFVFIYLCGRLFHISDVYISKNFKYLLAVSIAAACLTIFEVLSDTHFQTYSGFADYNFYMYNQEPTGNYGLSWTFEAQSGLKRFASFFSNPLEHAAATLLALAVIAGLYTTDRNGIKLDKFGIIAFAATQISVIFALSRASFVSYFLMIYVYAFVTRNKLIMNLYYIGASLVVIYFFYFLQNEDIYDFVWDTLTFENGSSIGHVIEWVEGIESMISNPFGLGLGSSGKVANLTDTNIGGENQFIILGVQVGVLGFLAYAITQFMLIKYPLQWINKLKGKDRKIALTLFLLKVGSIIPLLTAEFESYIYISYFSWFLSGLFISVVAGRKVQPIIISPRPDVPLKLNTLNA